MHEKIIMIGPVYPFKGGIAHYTSLMYQALTKKFPVELVSYRLQYPKFLFKKEQKDYANDRFEVKGTHFWLNTINPFNWMKTASFIKKMKPTHLLIQWWHPYFAPCYIALGILLRKIPITFVCHNVFPHERFLLDRFLTNRVLKRGTHFIVHSKEDEANLRSIIPETRIHLTPHPTYQTFKMKGMTQTEGKELLELGQNENLILFFGLVREYKGLKYLLRAMPQIIQADKNIKLIVAGDFGTEQQDYQQLIDELQIQNYIVVFDGYQPDHEVEKFFAACDLVVCPYVSATQSGIVQIAYGFEKPVLVTNVGGLPEVVEDGKTGYIVESCNPTQIAEKVNLFFGEKQAGMMHEYIHKEAERFSWDRMTELIEMIVR
jgi:glycosyltransferase involved in cell wall biosynthesis